jgi:Carboxypeptidase regulatory-like domain
MSRSFRLIIVGCVLLSAALLAQSDRGTLTGTVADPAGAGVPQARVVATEIGSGTEYPTVTTDTGNFTIPSLPAGNYQLSVIANGFRGYTQTGITIQVAQIATVSVALQMGSVQESVTVTSNASLLRSEDAEQSTTISRQQLNNLPINFAGTQAIRDPLAFVKLTPGANYNGVGEVRINGLPTATMKVLVEGQDATGAIVEDQDYSALHPSVDMMQEFTVQSSNFAPEFGQVGGGLFNFTARSGTNQLHGSGYEYFVNEFLNAGQPFTNNGNNQLIRPKNRQNDYGFTIGGPWYIPKLYDGRNKTFFFFGWERYSQNNASLGFLTMPTQAMRNGDFSQILTGRALGTDILGRPILENTIYDPHTAFTTANGQVVTNPYPRNLIPASQLNPVAVKIQSLFPASNLPGLVNNYEEPIPFPRTQTIPAIKVDQYMSEKWRLAFYWSQMSNDSFNSNDGLPDPITGRRVGKPYSDTYRLSSDYTVTPTLFLHAGIGYVLYLNLDQAPDAVGNYDAAGQLGLPNALTPGFPKIYIPSSNYGGLLNTGTVGVVPPFSVGSFGQNKYWSDKATATVSATWVHKNHTFKSGVDYKLDDYIIHANQNGTGLYNFSGAETALPYLQTTTVGGGQIGFPYASFLLGQVDGGQIGNPIINQYRRPNWATYVQDTWKITPKFTLTYGVRWEFTGTVHERYYRTSGFSPTTPNPSAGGLPGAMAYEGFGAGRCNCNFMPAYPYALGPRLGGAYQLNSKTVLRGGWGVVYGVATPFNYLGGNTNAVGVGFNVLQFSAPAFGTANTTLSNGFQYNPASVYTASLAPGIVPVAGSISNFPSPLWDPNGGRPSRINSWNISLQREITPNLLVEAAYVGNRGVWETSGDASNLELNNLNALSFQRIEAFGLNPSSAADRALLTSTFASGIPQQHGFQIPYKGFPLGATLAQALRPYPQFANVYTEFSPVGNSWYDALQAKMTERLSHGLQFLASFTWSKQLERGSDVNRGRGAPINDSLNYAVNKDISPEDQPFVTTISFTYQIPTPTLLGSSRFIRAALGGWQLGGIASIGSGFPIKSPTSTNNLSQLTFQSTFVNRVPGVSPFLINPNSHNFDPYTTAVLNPAAWVDPGPGNWGTAAAYYDDYRWRRVHDEEANLAKTFSYAERLSLQVRVEFFNVFNRTVLPMPSASNITLPQTLAVNGFGRINTGAVGSPRTGQIVARITF